MPTLREFQSRRPNRILYETITFYSPVFGYIRLVNNQIFPKTLGGQVYTPCRMELTESQQSNTPILDSTVKFGRLAQDDARFLPYTLADQSLRGSQPLMLALEYLLDLPQQRFSLSEVCDLLDVPAIQRRFGINSEAMPQLRLWLTEAGARWGLDAARSGSRRWR